MKNISKILILAFILLMVLGTVHAEKFRGGTSSNTAPTRAASTCLPATNSNQLTINNVRAYLETNGTMWFNEIAQYEVPIGSGKTSMFAAALWIGGLDVNQQLKLAAVRFRQKGDDFWTGPLTLNGASVSQATCSAYDKHYKITRAEVEEHIANWSSSNYVMPKSIRDWPAHPYDLSAGQSYYLAPFYDANEDGDYTPEEGDYPYYDINNDLCPWTSANRALAAQGLLPKTPEERLGFSSGMVYADHVLKGDETLYWIFNDKGGPHTESQGNPIGLEIRAQAFGFATNDDLNNMTFYSYEIINRSTFDLTDTYFSQWVDPDLGYANDDYVGCDVARGLGYCYNGTNVDGTGLVQHYGNQPPAVGVDFFQGPYLDPDGYDNPSFNGDGKFGPSMYGSCDIVTKNNTLLSFSWVPDPDANEDSLINDSLVLVKAEAINGVNFGDGIRDNERFGMRRFVYHNNDNSVVGDPSKAPDYYNMLKGRWKDNLKMKYGANAHPQNGADGPDCDFMFPGLSDPCNWGTNGVDPDIYSYSADGWTEAAVGNAPADRRFMQSAGPFTLKAGAVNYITVGIPWARAISGGAQASVDALKIADDQCQSLFENCFKVLDGPDAPDITIEELENTLIIYLSNSDKYNNYREQYEEPDPSIPVSYPTSVVIHDTVHYTTLIDGVEVDTFIVSERTGTEEVEIEDNTYKFEGYQIYQCASEDVSITDLGDLNKIRLIAQCDIKNGVSQLINWEYNDAVGTAAPVLKVDGEDNGIRHSFVVTEDKFATTSTQLINHKKYYFLAVAYAYNEYLPYSIENGAEGLLGQKTTYLAGRRNIGNQQNSNKPYVGIPHDPTPENQGTVAHSHYGTQPMITRIEGQGNGGYFLDMTDQCREEIVKNGKIDAITYKNNYGPLNIKVINPLKVQAKDFRLRFIDDSYDISDTTGWVLEVLNDEGEIEDVIYSEVDINTQNEQLVMDYGISISILNYDFQIHQEDLEKWVMNDIAHGTETQNISTHYYDMAMYAQCDFLGSSITYADPSKQWLSGIYDVDGNYPSNWIRSGQQTDGAWQDAGATQDGVSDEYARWKKEDFFIVMPKGTLNSSWQSRGWKDPEGQFEKILDGTWAPYNLASPYYGGPKANYVTPDYIGSAGTDDDGPVPSYYKFYDWAHNNRGYNQTLTNLYSVDIVLTPDKDKWTRCVVLEACDDHTKSEGGAYCHEPRKHPSVDKNGNPDGTGEGMGWFPGYAINVETGERLNMMFSENSADTLNNGNDMLFNPTSVYAYYTGEPMEINLTSGKLTIEGPTLQEWEYNLLFDLRPSEYGQSFAAPAFGGKHYVYVLGSSGSTDPRYYTSTSGAGANRNYNVEFDCGSYADSCGWVMDRFTEVLAIPHDYSSADAYKKRRQRKMRIFNNVMWTSIPIPAVNQEENWLSNDALIKIRVSRPYLRWSSAKGVSVDNPQNNNFPMYTFTTKNIAVSHNVASKHDRILEKINIVPNPYYGYSTYEGSALDNKVKIVNLPTYEHGVKKEVTISIYTVNGILVRKLTKGSSDTYVDWDLKNSANIPIASGVYIIYVNAPGIGERTLKFFAAMRPTDLNAF